MIEVASNEVSEEVLMKALDKAKEEIEKIQKFQETIIKELGVAKMEVKKVEIPTDLKEAFEKVVVTKIDTIVGEAGKDKIYALEEEWLQYLNENMPEADQKLAKVLLMKR